MIDQEDSAGSSSDEKDSPLTWKNSIAILFATILIGAIGSGLWDAGIKPSLLWFGQLVLDAITFGSSAAKDNAYHSAALDQTAAPAIRLYRLVTLTIPTALFMYFLMYEFLPPRKKYRLIRNAMREVADSADSPERRARLAEIRDHLNHFDEVSLRMIATLRRANIILLGLMIGFICVQGMIQNQSLLIWRSFHADLNQCAPYLTPDEEETIEAQYAAMDSKNAYSQILKKFEEIADQNNFELHSTKLW